MSKSTKQDRDTHFKKGAAMSDDDPRAYEPMTLSDYKKRKQNHHNIHKNLKECMVKN